MYSVLPSCKQTWKSVRSGRVTHYFSPICKHLIMPTVMHLLTYKVMKSKICLCNYRPSLVLYFVHSTISWTLYHGSFKLNIYKEKIKKNPYSFLSMISFQDFWFQLFVMTTFKCFSDGYWIFSSWANFDHLYLLRKLDILAHFQILAYLIFS